MFQKVDQILKVETAWQKLPFHTLKVKNKFSASQKTAISIIFRAADSSDGWATLNAAKSKSGQITDINGFYIFL